MMRVSLYRKQIDFCKECGRLGHRPDVRPRPDDKLCSACGAKNPAKDHEFTPKCKLPGEAHPTVDRTCRAKFMVILRGWTARRNEELLRVDKTPTPGNNRQPPPGRERGYDQPRGPGVETGPGAARDPPRGGGSPKRRGRSKNRRHQQRPAYKMEKMFEMLAVSDSEAERKAQALKYDRRLAALEKKIS
ncbi:hypothetical protein HPB49_010887 [Dermacentor silvarum]|uniref:Uncharacterized protein n=1 Tax=Dermacentor silvarum TaxID=543639 RepID=A0ACB8CWQ6_DERSI|nr:hypothetical protein HPB49_010887 [Dermacentor silvarum]